LDTLVAAWSGLVLIREAQYIYPARFTEETLQKLSLLFPKTYKDTKKWFKKLSITRNLDSKAMNYGRLKAEA
jgi:hypothetical protein